MCRTPKGCPIKNILKYPEIVSTVEAFLNKKILENHKGYDSQISHLVNSSNLKNIETALKLESIFGSWLEYKRKQKAQNGK